jgi:hypothetical protein
MAAMEDFPPFDQDKVDECTLALLYLVVEKRTEGGGARVWKAFDWATMDRLHAKGLIESPRSKSRSVRMTEEAFLKARTLFNELFGLPRA